jgi:site-specific DNA recombinase
MTRSLYPPIKPRNGRYLRVIGIARISGDNQDEKSLADQKQLLRRWLKDNVGPRFKLLMISTRGSGERLDRSELGKLRRLIRKSKFDLVLAEDLGRICRRIDAYKICESCQDHDMRLVAINDNIDTGQDSWKTATMFAAMRHESYNADTAKRIRRTLRNRFMQGGVLMTHVFCYEKPAGAKSDAELRKIDEMAPIIEGIFSHLEDDWSYSEVADWLNEQKVPTGKWCRSDRWDCAMVGRIVRNPILKGVRVRNRKMTRRVNSTGRRKSINAPLEELLERPCPHLAFVTAERYDRLLAKLKRKNAHFAVGKKKADPRLGRPKKRTMWPGQHVTCGVCGRGYVYGGHGRTKYLMCAGAREYKCWNGVTFEATEAACKLSAAVSAAIMETPVFDEHYDKLLREATAEQGSSRTERLAVINSARTRCQRQLDNMVEAIKGAGGSPVLYQELKALEEQAADLTAQAEEIQLEPATSTQLPSLEELRQLALMSFEALPRESHEFAKVMKKLITTIVVYPYRLIDGGPIVLRAKFGIALTALAPKLRNLPIDMRVFRPEVTVNLYEEPQRVTHREEVVKLIGQGIYQREVGQAVGITQPAVQNALKLHKLMVEANVSDPYLAVTELPDNCQKLRRHKHPRYQFQPKPPTND